MAREKIIALGKKMTDRIPYKLGLEKLTESDPEYYGLECVVTDDEARVEVELPWMLAMLAETIKGRVSQQGTKLLERK